jgi:hypothetical protein
VDGSAIKQQSSASEKSCCEKPEVIMKCAMLVVGHLGWASRLASKAADRPLDLCNADVTRDFWFLSGRKVFGKNPLKPTIRVVAERL